MTVVLSNGPEKYAQKWNVIGMANLTEKLDFLPIAHALNFLLIFLLFLKFLRPSLLTDLKV